LKQHEDGDDDNDDVIRSSSVLFMVRLVVLDAGLQWIEKAYQSEDLNDTSAIE